MGLAHGRGMAMFISKVTQQYTIKGCPQVLSISVEVKKQDSSLPDASRDEVEDILQTLAIPSSDMDILRKYPPSISDIIINRNPVSVHQ
jgi:hypothetical protein